MWNPKWAFVVFFIACSPVLWTLENNLSCATRDLADLRVKQLNDAVHIFRIRRGRWPTQTEGLAALTRPGPRGKRILKAVPKDPWRRPFVWVPTEDGGRILSRGPDGILGTRDDFDPASGRDYPHPLSPRSWTWILSPAVALFLALPWLSLIMALERFFQIQTHSTDGALSELVAETDERSRSCLSATNLEAVRSLEERTRFLERTARARGDPFSPSA